MKEVEDYIRSLGLDAYVVGGAVRDELLGVESKDADFLVPGVDIDGLRAALQPHGRTEDLVVAGRAVGLRLRPRERASASWRRPASSWRRRAASSRPGRAATTSRSSSTRARRSRRISSAATSPSTRSPAVSPTTCSSTRSTGRRTSSAGSCARCRERSFAEDPLRIVRGLRFVSQLDFTFDEQTLAQMREEADSVRLVSGERIGGGLAADGLGELSKLLLGAQPAKALRLARDTGVLVALLPEFEPAIGFDQESRYHDLTVDEHTFAVVQAAADAGAPLRVRLAALFHDLGKPLVAWRGGDGRLHYYRKPGIAPRGHATVGAELADDALRRLRYPNELRRRVVSIVRGHMFDVGRGDALRARRFLWRHGDELAERPARPQGGRSARARPPTRASSRLQQLERLRRLSARSSTSSGRARTGSATSRSTATT